MKNVLPLVYHLSNGCIKRIIFYKNTIKHSLLKDCLIKNNITSCYTCIAHEKSKLHYVITKPKEDTEISIAIKNSINDSSLEIENTFIKIPKFNLHIS